MRALLVWSLLASAVLSGCGSLLREPAPTVWVGIEPSLPAGGLRSGGPSLEVEAFSTSAPFDNDQVSTREGPYRWDFAYYHRWVAEPGEMVAAEVREYLSRSDLFGAVSGPPGTFNPDYRLGGAVRSLYWDRSRKTAVVEAEASLTARRDRLLGFWVYRVEEPVEGNGVEAYLRAASAGLTRLLADLRHDVSRTIRLAAPASTSP